MTCLRFSRGIDLSGRDLGESMHASSLDLPKGVRLAIGDRDFTVASIATPSGLRSETAADDATATEGRI